MAIYHSSGQIIGRSGGRSAVAAAAYRSGAKLVEIVADRETGLESSQVWDYSKKGGIEFSAILAPEGAPPWALDREQLWNEVHKSEKRKNSQFARDFTIALPCELNAEQNAELLVEIAKECFVSHGMIADLNMHYDNPNNPHAHIMITMRDLVKFDDGKMHFGLKNRSWNSKALLYQIREQQASIINKHLEMHGYEARVSHQSHKERGIELEPTIHIGPAGNKIEGSDRKKINDEIIKNNARRILENPELVLDRLSVNKPVFTKEDIAVALTKELLVIRNEQDKIIGSLAGEETKIKASNLNNLGINTASLDGLSINIETPSMSIGANNYESLNKSLSEVFMSAYLEVLNSKNLSLIVQEDLKGRTLYALTKRINLEDRYIEVVELLASAKNHNLNIKERDLGKYSKSEQLIENIKKHAETLDEKLHLAIGFKFGVTSDISKELSIEQTKAITEVLNGNDLCVLEGLPGTGKTTVLREINRQYKKAGYRLIGAAPSSAAALNLASKAGIEAKNTAQWRKIWQKERGEEFELNLKADYFNERNCNNQAVTVLNSKDVLIIDEASMVELANMDYLLSEAKKAKAKVILVGDNNQFAAVGMQGALKLAAKKAQLSRLAEVRRQINPNHAKATQLLGNYQITEALDIYKEEKCFSIHDTEREVKKVLIKDYVDAYLDKARSLEKDDLAASKSIVICAYTNKAVHNFNEEIREKLKAAGIIKGKEYEYKFGNKTIKLGVGDQIVFDRNDSYLDVLNGEVGTVLKCYAPDVHGNGKIKLAINKADGSCKKIILDTKAYGYNKYTKNVYKQTISYGYAVTAYKLQGATINQTLVYYEPNVGYEAFNVMMTRHKEQVKMYSSREVLENVVYSKLAANTNEDREPYTTEYEIKSEKDLWAIGLAISVSKRTNLSLSADYLNHHSQLSNEDKTLKTYLESNINLIKTLKIINKDLAKQQQKENKGAKLIKKANIWEHEAWESVKAYKIVRDLKAQEICNNYDMYKDKIIRLDLNFETIRRHAKISDYGYKVESTTYRQENTIAPNDNYRELLELCNEIRNNQINDNLQSQTITSGVSDNNQMSLIDKFNESLQDLRIDISNSELEIEAAKDELKTTTDKRYELEDTISYAEEYERKLFPEYLSRIYKNSKEEILDNWRKIVQKEGFEAATMKVNSNPKLLGELIGRGLGSWVGFDYKRCNAIIISKELTEKLEGSFKLKQAAENARTLIRENDFVIKEQSLLERIEALSFCLPNKVEHEFINEAVKIHVLIESSSMQLQSDENFKQLEVKKRSYRVDAVIIELKKFAQSESTLNASIDYYNAAAHDDISLNEAAVHHEQENDIKRAASYRKLPEKSNIDSAKIESLLEPTRLNSKYVSYKSKVKVQETVDLSKELKKELNVEISKHEGLEIKKDLLPSITETAKINNLLEHVKASNKNKYNKPTSIPKDIDKFKDINGGNAQRLGFVEVKQALTMQHCEQIFRDYSHFINSDGKIIKKGNSISNGSLHMDLKYSNRGLWYRFSTSEKGDIFEFVRVATGSSKYESLKIVAEVAGIDLNSNDKVNKDYSNNAKNNASRNVIDLAKEIKPKELVNDWIAHTVVPEDAPKFEGKKHIAYMLKSNKLTEQYNYKDENGKLIGITARLQDKETGKKQVLPVSYCHNEALGRNEWRLKGFTDDKGLKPIYKLEEVKAGLKPVLIVEGEKTANRAGELLPEYTVISWLGGSNAAKNVNCQHLKAREVIIWPDNDEPGKKAAYLIAESINSINNNLGRVTIIDPDKLKLPEKWDLGDELPKELSVKDIRKEISRAVDETKELNHTSNVESDITQSYANAKQQHQDTQENIKEYGDAKQNSQNIGKKASKSLEQELRILWQQRSKGIIFAHNEIKVKSAEYQAWNEKLSSPEAKYYMRYIEVREKQSSSHEFLKLEHSLYKDTLIEIAKENAIKFDLANKGLPDLIDHLQEEYSARKRESIAKNSISMHDNLEYSKAKQNLKGKEDRQELFKTLVNDLALLHELQLKNNNRLSVDYLDQLSNTAYEAVSGYSKPQIRGTNSDKLSPDDQVKIADNLYNKINFKEWWQDLASKRTGKYQQEVVQEHKEMDKFLAGHKVKLQEIKDINANYNFEQLKHQLKEQNPVIREQVLDKEWVGVIKPKVILKIETIVKNKKQAQTVEQVMVSLKEEAILVTALHKHPVLEQVKEEQKELGEYLSKMHIAYKNQPNIITNMERDALLINKLGLMSEDKIVHELKDTIDIGKVALNMFKIVQNHHVENTIKDLKKMKTEDHIIFEGKKFTSPLKYMEYKMHQDHHLSPYLKSSSIEKIHKELTNYVKVEQQKIKDKSLDLDHQLTK